MRTQIVRPATAQDDLDKARPMVAGLVRCEEYVTGSKMLAYSNVGHAIGKSASWVRKLIGRHDVAIRRFELVNIARAYAAVCERVEAAAAAQRRLAELLEKQADEAGESDPGLDLGLESPPRGGAPAGEQGASSAGRPGQLRAPR